MTSLPIHVLQGTPKEATAYICQIRAMRRASAGVRNSLDNALLKQAYSWNDFTAGLSNSAPLSYGIAGAGGGALIAALNELRRKKKQRNYSNILLGAGIGGGIGAGGAYLNRELDPAGMFDRAFPGEPTPPKPNKPDPPKLISEVEGLNDSEGNPTATQVMGPDDGKPLAEQQGSPTVAILGSQGDDAVESAVNLTGIPARTLTDVVGGDGEALTPLVAGLGTSAMAHGGMTAASQFGEKVLDPRIAALRAQATINRMGPGTVVSSAMANVWDGGTAQHIVSQDHHNAARKWLGKASDKELKAVINGGVSVDLGPHHGPTGRMSLDVHGIREMVAGVQLEIPSNAGGAPIKGSFDNLFGAGTDKKRLLSRTPYTTRPGAWRNKQHTAAKDYGAQKINQIPGAVTNAGRGRWKRIGASLPGALGIGAALLAGGGNQGKK